MKPWWKSKTVWVAILTGIAAIGNQISPTITDPQTLNFVALAVACSNVLLRFATSEEIR